MPASFFFGTLGFALLGYGFWRWRTVAAMHRWPVAAGRIEKLAEEKRLHSQDGITMPYYVPRIEVAYEVAGATHRTTRFALHNFTIGTTGEIRELLKGAAVGGTIEVRYDPARPARGLILLPSHDGAFVVMFIGSIIVALTALAAA